MPKSSSGSSKAAKPPSSRTPIGLGRGLTEIIAEGARHLQGNTSGNTISSPIIASAIRQIPLSQIVANPRQPRLRFVEEPLDELVGSIREHGVLQPITVRPRDHNQFEIIAGERRARACQKAGLATIPAIVKQVSDVEAYELALIENLQRENLDPIEEARGYRKLADEFSLTQEEIAKKIGKNRATVANTMRLLDLPEEIQNYLTQDRLSVGHAKVILSLATASQQTRVARDVIKRGLNVRQTEALIARFSSTAGRAKASSTISTDNTPTHLRAIQEALQQKLATKVQIHSTSEGGRIEIHYYTPSDLDRLIETFGIQL